MIWTIARKEFLTSLLTYRFAFAFGACALLMGLSAYSLADDYSRRLEAHRAELLREEEQLEEIKVYAQLQLYTHRSPSPLSIFSEGLEKRLGSILHFSHSYVPTMLTWRKENNPLMDAFPAFDLATIAGLLFSLMALFCSFDAICGEREGGTLRMMGSNAVARHQILIGKWLGGMLCTALPGLAGFLVALLVLVNTPQVHFTPAEWLRGSLIFVVSLVYMSVFYLIGLCLSARVRLPSTALVLAILVWTLSTVVLPTATSYLVGETMPMRTEQAAREARQRAERNLFDRFMGLYEIVQKERGAGPFGAVSFNSTTLGIYIWGNGFFREMLPEMQAWYARIEPQRTESAEEIGQLEDRVMADRIAQVEMDRRIGRFFLGPAFAGAAAALAGTDLASFQDFIQHARRCRQSLVSHLQEQDIFASLRFFTANRLEEFLTREETAALQQEGEQPGFRPMNEWDPLDLSAVPRFPEYRPVLITGVRGMAIDLAVLGLANAALLLLALRWFVRRDLV